MLVTAHMMYLDHLLHEDNLHFGLEEASSGDDCEDDPIDDLAHLTQLLHALALQVTLQVLTIEHLVHKEYT